MVWSPGKAHMRGRPPIKCEDSAGILEGELGWETERNVMSVRRPLIKCEDRALEYRKGGSIGD